MSDGQKRDLIKDVRSRQSNVDNPSYDVNTPTYNKYANFMKWFNNNK